MRYQRAGFTLIELLVVIFIISIVTTVALLSIGQNEKKQLESFAEELTQVILFAEEQAKLQPMVVGLTLQPQSYQFSVLNEGDAKQHWLPVKEPLLRKRTFPHKIVVSIAHSGDEVDASMPQIIISANGDMTPFDIDIAVKGHEPAFRLHGESDGSVSKIAL